ncbi:hypothetical protein BZA05DRAFT_76588 [Tricharina praecox]|uniref:uncharacterized protein n=1 Tax=Tricharina praecox TaxID=43433 RepID=UPI00221EAEBC|nr:uncharacterized protein BZA05DRAFT_76588 [Tricharina praecox]KAI5849768.1 hypothetical protein BZA05DRAFT_76588 [Tricharina praecox]
MWDRGSRMGMVACWKSGETMVRRAKLMGSGSFVFAFYLFFYFAVLCSGSVLLCAVRLAGWFGFVGFGALIVGGDGNVLFFPGPIPLGNFSTFLLLASYPVTAATLFTGTASVFTFTFSKYLV